MDTHVFFIDSSDEFYEMSKTDGRTELAKNIKNLKVIAYGLNVGGQFMAMTPSQVTDWNAIRALRIDLTAKKTFSIYILLLEQGGWGL